MLFCIGVFIKYALELYSRERERERYVASACDDSHSFGYLSIFWSRFLFFRAHSLILFSFFSLKYEFFSHFFSSFPCRGKTDELVLFFSACPPHKIKQERGVKQCDSARERSSAAHLVVFYFTQLFLERI